MSAAWAAFARTGNPNHADMPNWPAFEPNNSADDDVRLDGARRERPEQGRALGARGAAREAAVLSVQLDGASRKQTFPRSSSSGKTEPVLEQKMAEAVRTRVQCDPWPVIDDTKLLTQRSPRITKTRKRPAIAGNSISNILDLM